jgi:hypothetical protein
MYVYFYEKTLAMKKKQQSIVDEALFCVSQAYMRKYLQLNQPFPQCIPTNELMTSEISSVLFARQKFAILGALFAIIYEHV